MRERLYTVRNKIQLHRIELEIMIVPISLHLCYFLPCYCFQYDTKPIYNLRDTKKQEQFDYNSCVQLFL